LFLEDIFEQFSLENILAFYIFQFITLVSFLIIFRYLHSKKIFDFRHLNIYFFVSLVGFIVISYISIEITLLCICLIGLYIYLNINLSFYISQQSLGSLYNMLYCTLVEIVEKNIVLNSDFYCILLLEIGVTIALLNLLGMVPYSCSVTSQIIFPFSLSLIFFIFNNMIGIYCYQYKLFNLFMPGGVPLFITPLLMIIEYISYFARIFSLSIRLCANMVSVHVLLKILVGFICILLFNTLWAQYLLSLMLGILLLDISTCCLQAYIFVFLSLIYLSNILFLH